MSFVVPDLAGGVIANSQPEGTRNKLHTTRHQPQGSQTYPHCTVSVTLVVWVMEPDTALTVTTYGPGGVPAEPECLLPPQAVWVPKLIMSRTNSRMPITIFFFPDRRVA